VSDFIYKLNAMENAAQQKNPNAAGYGEKRKAVLEHVSRLEKKLERVNKALLACTEWIKEKEQRP
jgi:hypothetical protein